MEEEIKTYTECVGIFSYLHKKTVLKIEFQKLNSRLSIFAVYQTWTCSKNICRIVDMQRMPYLIYMQELQISLTNFNDILQKIDNYVTNPTTTKIS